MKRFRVTIDPKLLREARRLSGEKSDAETITKALENFVYGDLFEELRREWIRIARERQILRDGYVEEIHPRGFCIVRRDMTLEEKRASVRKRRSRTA